MFGDVNAGGQCPAQSVGVVNTMMTTLFQALTIAHCDISHATQWPQDNLEQVLSAYDYIVVGAGSAGSVISSRLSEDLSKRVLVLEAGGDPPQESEVPSLSFEMLNTNFTWNYFAEPNGKSCLSMRDHRCYWPRGKMLGGTGSLNGMLYILGNKQNYDDWVALGNTNWSWKEVYPYFLKSSQPVGNQTHPRGYMNLEEFPRHNIGIQNMIIAASQELGIQYLQEFKEGSNVGISRIPGTVQNGRRASTAKRHLARVAKRDNLHIIKNALVTRINFNHAANEVESINFSVNGRDFKVNVENELILSAGSIGSAKLLLQSGVGPRKDLEALNIPVVRDLKVGYNLQDHIFFPIFFRIPAKLAEPASNRRNLNNIFNFMINTNGPYAAPNIIYLMQLLNTNKSSQSGYPDIENIHLFYPLGSHDDLRTVVESYHIKEAYQQHILKYLDDSHVLTVFSALLQPLSVGSLHLKSTNPHDPPIIYSNFMEHPRDIETAMQSIRVFMEMEQTETYRQNNIHIAHIPIEECDVHSFKSDAYWSCYLKYFTTTFFHPVGTVKMGPSTDPNACVDTKLRLYGTNNLRVVDGSIMPRISSGNTNADIIMFAERTADFIRSG